MYAELRVYTIKREAMDAWVAEWLEHVYALRLRHGFRIPAAWVADESRFVWLLEYDGDDYVEANDAYYDSDARRAVDPEPTRHVERTEHWPLRRVL